MTDTTLQTAIDALRDFYKESGLRRSTEYAFGFFDALSVLEQLRAEAKR